VARIRIRSGSDQKGPVTTGSRSATLPISWKIFCLGYWSAEGLGHDARAEGDLHERVLRDLPHHDVHLRLHVWIRRDFPLRLPQGWAEILLKKDGKN
jgi:hypothetical protein